MKNVGLDFGEPGFGAVAIDNAIARFWTALRALMPTFIGA
ncbi:hypothetical protein V473_19250 [Sphingobium cupriresistens LL01]|uniref:Uncharacterized protein n=1 Tax=Sphingobium cupriresistens LL01 TaxID=1420583 RepID=A0A0J7XP12_9SPHN|nr:hypothetical protein V473_19250 [Sphingobium cupriresistens LL01]WCP15290.1 hypothetical protein sphantq_03751 [Sphingobium sp. AntQ-1]